VKKIALGSSFIFAFLLLSSCSTETVTNKFHGKSSGPDGTRQIASKEFQCSFNEVIDGKKINFIFNPENLLLTIFDDENNASTLTLLEDDFVSGGFTYSLDKDKTLTENWKFRKMDFISFTDSPKVVLQFLRTPASDKALKITKPCE
jgi:hypothetical protein